MRSGSDESWRPSGYVPLQSRRRQRTSPDCGSRWQGMLVAASQGEAHVHAIKNAEFHATIMRAARNDALLRAWQVLEPLLRTYITATLPGVDLEWLARRHEGLLSAIESHDADLAEKRMREHLTEVEEATEAATNPSGARKTTHRV